MNHSSKSAFQPPALHQTVDDRQMTNLPVGQPQESHQFMSRQIEKFLGSLLVVDDIEMNRDSLARRLARSGHTVKTADNGASALEMLAAEPFDLVLLDVMMPGMSGLEVLAKIRETKSAEVLPVIMATAKSESEDIVTALKIGANDYVTKPLDFAVVRARVQTQLALKRANELLAVNNNRMKQSLDAAARVQRSCLPRQIDIPGYKFDWRFIPCDELAGDGLNIMAFDGRNVIICAWDVSGHGVPAALHSVSVSHLLNPSFGKSSIMMTNGWTSPKLSSPVEVLTRLNDSFQVEGDDPGFLTLCYGILNMTSGIFKYASAGHPYPIHVRGNDVLKTAELNGTPIGVSTSDECQYEQAEIQLQPGDRLFLFSDGVEDAVNEAGKPFGINATQEACRDVANQSIEDCLSGLVERMANWRGSKSFGDDVSMIAIQRLATPLG